MGLAHARSNVPAVRRLQSDSALTAAEAVMKEKDILELSSIRKMR